MDTAQPFNISLGLEGTHVIVTGGAGAIGSVVVDAFIAAGCHVTVLDIDKAKLDKLSPNSRLLRNTVDIADEDSVKIAFEAAVEAFGPVSVCIAAAGRDLSYIPHHGSIADMPLSQWAETMRVNGQGTFLTSREWMRGVQNYGNSLSKNLSLIVFGSEAGTLGVKSNADYSSSKALMVGLVRSLAPDAAALHPRARVNLICPGAVDTPQFRKECAEDSHGQWVESEATVAQKAPVPMSAVARACLFLASEVYSGSITGQTVPIDGGKSGRLYWLPDGTTC